MRARYVVVAGAVLVACSLSGAADWATADGSCYAKKSAQISAAITFLHFGFYGAFDYGVHDAISVGAGLGYNGYSYSNDWRYNYFPIVARGGFHPFNLKFLADKIKIRDKLDVYLGPSIGYSIGWASWKGSGSSTSSPKVGWFVIREFVGAKFFFNPKFGVFVEDCAGMGYISIGATLKL